MIPHTDILSLLPQLFACCWLITLASIDLASGKLPNVLTYTGMIAGWAWHFLQHDLHLSLFGSLCGFVLIFTINTAYYCMRDNLGMGWGDAKMLAMLGSWLGPGKVISILAWACVQSSGFVLIIFSIKKSLPASIPFGPWLALGTLVVTLF